MRRVPAASGRATAGRDRPPASCVASAALPNAADSLLTLFRQLYEGARSRRRSRPPPRLRVGAIPSVRTTSREDPFLAPWAIQDEDNKHGAGLLFFAYGQLSAIQKYLREATDAAASFRALNPKLQIAIVSNNGTVDARVFSHHITPRPDLLFAGRPFANGADPMPRQWLTRLYYMAHSPYALTWALDSACFVRRRRLARRWRASSTRRSARSSGASTSRRRTRRPARRCTRTIGTSCTSGRGRRR